MSLWFSREKQVEILLKYLPIGRAYKQAFVEGSNFNNLIKWISFSFQALVDKYNRTFKGLYVCESDYLIERWKADYSIPNGFFYLSEEENKIDIFVLRYLMRGNTKWHFQAIANIYNVDVIITNAKDYFSGSRLPNRIPHRLHSRVENVNNVLIVSFLEVEYDQLPHSIPHKLGSGRKLDKIKKIYQIIKQAQCKILYLPVSSTVTNIDSRDVLPTEIPHVLGIRQIIDIVYDGVNKDERIKFCKGSK